MRNNDRSKPAVPIQAQRQNWRCPHFERALSTAVAMFGDGPTTPDNGDPWSRAVSSPLCSRVSVGFRSFAVKGKAANEESRYEGHDTTLTVLARIMLFDTRFLPLGMTLSDIGGGEKQKWKRRRRKSRTSQNAQQTTKSLMLCAKIRTRAWYDRGDSWRRLMPPLDRLRRMPTDDRLK